MTRFRRLVRWIAAAAGGLMLLAVAGLIVIQTGWFRNWLRGQAVTRAASVLNGELRLARIGGDLWTGVTLDGVEIFQNGEPVITADRIVIRYNLRTLLRRQWVFDDIVLERAAVNVAQTAEGWNVGRLIRPRDRPGAPPSLSIKRLRIVSGIVTVAPAAAPARRLTGVHLDTALSVDRGRVAMHVASLRAHDDATGLTVYELSGRAQDTFREFDMAIAAGSTATTIKGRVRGHESEDGREVSADLTLTRFDLSRVLQDPRWVTDVTGRLSARLVRTTGQPVGVDFTFSGTDVAALGYAASAIDAKGRVDATHVAFSARVHAYDARATVVGDWRIPALGLPGAFAGRGTFAGVDLRRLPPQWRLPPLATTLAGEYDARWTPGAWSARTSLAASTVEGAAIAAGTAGDVSAQDGVVSYSATGDLANLNVQRLAAPLNVAALADARFATDIAGRFVVNGLETGEAGGRQLIGEASLGHAQVSGTDVSGMRAKVGWAGRQLAIEAHGAFAGLNNTTAAPLTVPIALSGQVDGRLVIPDLDQPVSDANLEFDGRVILGRSTVREVAIDQATIEGRLAAGVADIRTLDVRGPTASLQAVGRLSLAGHGTSDLRVLANTADLSAIGGLIAQPIRGGAALDAHVTGTAASPAASGTVTLHQPAYADVASALTSSVTFTGEWPDRAPDRLALEIDASATFVEVKGTRIQQLTAKASGSLTDLTLELQAEEGKQTLEFRGQVTVNDDARELLLRRLALGADGMRWTLPENGSAVVRFRPGQVDWQGLTLVRGDQRIGVEGRIHTALDLRVSVERVAVADLNRLLLGTQTPTGELNGTVLVSGERQAPVIDAELTVRDGAVQEVKYESASARLRVENRRAVVDATLVQSAGVSLTAKGTVPIGLDGLAGAGMDLRVQGGPIALGLVQAFTEEVTKVTGSSTIDLHVTGTPSAPEVRGSVSITGGGFLVGATGVRYDKLDALVEFEGSSLAVRRFELADPDGHLLSASGALGVLGAGADREVDVTVRARKVSVIRNSFGTADVDADLQLTGTLGALRLEGTVTLDSGRLEVAQILEKTTRNPYSTTPQAPLGGEAAAPPPTAFDQMSLKVHLTLPDNLTLRGRQLRVGSGSFGIGDMNILAGGEFDIVKAPKGRLEVTGTAEVVRGTYTFQGRRFDVVPGSEVRFPGGPPSDPLINVTATRDVSGITAQVRLQGPARNPQIALSSRPPLDEGDVLSLIVFNQPMNSLSATEQVNLGERAASIAAGAITTPLADSIARALNLDLFEIQVPTSDNGTGAVAFGTRLGSRVFVGVRRQFGREEASVVSLEYRVTEVLRLVSSVAQGALQAHATRRMDQSSVDLIFVIRY
jgi:autotransporter translocation and assembly factor TamB